MRLYAYITRLVHDTINEVQKLKTKIIKRVIDLDAVIESINYT